MRRARRHVRVPPDLTSLFDVLFIVIFAALIRAAAVQAAAKPKPPPARPVPLDPSSLRARALAELGAELAARPALIVRVSATGTVSALEADGATLAIDAPLLEHSADPDVVLSYLGDRAADLRVCRIAAVNLHADLARYLVIVAPERPLADLPHALYDGLHHDLDRCLAEQHAIAALVDPSAPPVGGAVGPVRVPAVDPELNHE
jgi:hypothetical protein